MNLMQAVHTHIDAFIIGMVVAVGVAGLYLAIRTYIASKRAKKGTKPMKTKKQIEKEEAQVVADLITDALLEAYAQGKLSAKAYAKWNKRMANIFSLSDLAPRGEKVLKVALQAAQGKRMSQNAKRIRAVSQEAKPSEGTLKPAPPATAVEVKTKQPSFVADLAERKKAKVAA